jgi:hypothetical protein
MSGSAREATTRGEVALNEDVEDAGKRLAAITLAKVVATGGINRNVFIKELFKEWGLSYEGILPNEPSSIAQNSTSTGSAGARASRSYVTMDDRIHKDEYRDVIYTLVKGAMATENCTWESIDGSTWDFKLTSHQSLSDWIDLFSAGLPRGQKASDDEKKRIGVLHEGSETMSLSRQYLTSHRHDPHKLRHLLEKQLRALQTDHHPEWPQHKLIRIIGQCRNLTGAVDSDDGDTAWYIVGIGDVFCPGGDQCQCPPGKIMIKAECVETRWYDETVHLTHAWDCSAGGEGEGEGEGEGGSQQREDNLPYLHRVDVFKSRLPDDCDGRSPPGVIDCERPFLWPLELIEYDFQGAQHLKNGSARYTCTSARRRQTGGAAGRGGRGGGSGRRGKVCGRGRGRGRGRGTGTATATDPSVDVNAEEDVGEKRRRTTGRGTQQHLHHRW